MLGSKALLSIVKDAARAQHIAAVLTRHGFAQVLSGFSSSSTDKNHSEKISLEESAILEEELVNGEARAEVQAPQGGRTLGDRFVAVLIDLGPTFVKFGQILSTRPDIVPVAIASKLSELQDNVAPMPDGDVKHIIHAAYKKDVHQVFSHFDWAPLASASIAQVHTAILPTGESVVVKIQRPNLKPLIESDLSLLRFLARRAQLIFRELELLDVDGMVQEFEKSLLNELDFILERKNIETFRHNFRLRPTIHIPLAYPELSSSNILVMERIFGKKLTLITEEEERLKTARLYLDCAYKMLFEDGFFHGDMHPGNVFLENDGRLGVIDFGMVGRLSRVNREKVVDVVFALMNDDLEGIARIWLSLGLQQRSFDYQAYERDVVQVLETHIVGKQMEEWDLGVFFRDLVKGAHKYGVRIPSDFTMMFKAMVTTEGLSRQIARGINPVEAAKPYIENIVKERYGPERMAKIMRIEGLRLLEGSRHAPARLLKLLDVAAGEGVVLQVRSEALEQRVDKMAGALRRLAFAMIVCAMMVFSLFVASEKIHLSLFLQNPLAILSGVFFMAGVIWIVWGELRGK